MFGANIPAFLGLYDMNTFNRREMAATLGLPPGSDRVDSLNGQFDPARFFCLVGTNSRDYDVAFGLSRFGAGSLSDGLVRIANATVQGAPRAFVHRSHSGPYGIVNSEEGYQNLVRFLFGDVRIDAVLDVHQAPLPPAVERARTQGHQIRASYYFECSVSPRGAVGYKLTERTRATESAILRTYAELFEQAPKRPPVLFSTFLDTRKILHGSTLVFAVDLAVSCTGYEVDGILSLKDHIPGENLFRDTLVVRATRGDAGWNLRTTWADDAQWGEQRGTEAKRTPEGFLIPLKSKKGFAADLHLHVHHRPA